MDRESPCINSFKITRWVEKRVGGKVISIERQPRWRPIYFIDAERDGELLRLCARQARTDMPMMFPLRHEMTFQRLLHEHGILVPRVYGWCDDPACYIMDALPGVDHLQGLDADGRQKVMFAYMEQLARLHALPVGPFKRAGIFAAQSPADAHVAAQRRYEALYRADKRKPDPFLEFALGFIKRHSIGPSSREAVVVWDGGQFLRSDSDLIALIDLELGHVGDPMMDLAGMRLRDTVLDFGDLTTLYRHYAKFSGRPLDWDAVKYHHLFFALTNALNNNAAMAAPVKESDYMVNMQWVNETNRFALEAIAGYMGLDLPVVELPEDEQTPATVAFAQLVRILREVDADDPMTQHELRGAFRLARHLTRWDEIGRAIMQDNLDDINVLIGRRPGNWREGETMLEEFVMADNGRSDEALIALFNRRLQRAQALNGPRGSAIARHLILQPFPAEI